MRLATNERKQFSIASFSIQKQLVLSTKRSCSTNLQKRWRINKCSLYILKSPFIAHFLTFSRYPGCSDVGKLRGSELSSLWVLLLTSRFLITACRHRRSRQRVAEMQQASRSLWVPPAPPGIIATTAADVKLQHLAHSHVLTCCTQATSVELRAANQEGDS